MYMFRNLFRKIKRKGFLELLRRLKTYIHTAFMTLCVLVL